MAIEAVIHQVLQLPADELVERLIDSLDEDEVELSPEELTQLDEAISDADLVVLPSPTAPWPHRGCLGGARSACCLGERDANRAMIVAASISATLNGCHIGACCAVHHRMP